MQQICAILFTSALLTACGGEGSSEKNPSIDVGSSNEDGSVMETHRVCKIDDSGDGLISNQAIDETEEWVLIDSMIVASSGIDLKSVPESDLLIASSAAFAFLAPSLADAFSPLYSIYTCSEATYSLNQCNWELDNSEGGLSKVETVIGSEQRYTATVSTRADATSSLQQSLVLEGIIGDQGNITFVLYENGVSAGSREATRSSDGTETVRWTSEATNWIATETSNCTGSLEYEDIRDTETIAVDAQWSLGGANTTGALDYQITGEFSASFSTNW
jgi:hypothetical protein